QPRPARPPALPRGPRSAGHDDRRAPAASVRRHRARRRHDRHRLPRETALRALDQRRLLLHAARGPRAPRRTLSARARAAGVAGGGRPAARLPPRGLLGLHGHVQGRGDAQRPVGERRGAVEDLGVRSAFVTGGYGLLGSWLCRALLDRGVRVAVLQRDEAAVTALALDGTEARCTVVRGDVRDVALIERVLGEEEVDTVFHLAAQTVVLTALHSPMSTWETNIRGT